MNLQEVAPPVLRVLGLLKLTTQAMHVVTIHLPIQFCSRRRGKQTREGNIGVPRGVRPPR
jgi:hypothetical protein